MTSERGRDGVPTEHPEEPNRTGVFVVDTDAERDDAFAVRRSVFVDEQGVAAEVEYDEYDDPEADATHFVAYADGVAVGAARLRSADPEPKPHSRPDGGPTGKVERVAVAADRRGNGWGRRLMDAVEARAREAGFERVALHAQTRVRGFYDRLGYEAYGAEFEEAGIPHIAMETELGDGV